MHKNIACNIIELLCKCKRVTKSIEKRSEKKDY